MVAFLIALALAGEVTQADIDAYAKRSQLERPKALVEHKKLLVAVRRSQSLPRERKRVMVDTLTARIKSLSDDATPYYPPMKSSLGDPADRDIGFLDTAVKVFQVIDEDTAIVGTYSDANRLMTYWLDGVGTSNYADDKEVDLRGIFKLGGTESYDTTDGDTSTVRVLEAVDIEPHKSLFTINAR